MLVQFLRPVAFCAAFLLTASAALLMWAARKGLRTGWPYVVRQGVANLYRPGNQTRAVTLALGFGASHLVLSLLGRAALASTHFATEMPPLHSGTTTELATRSATDS